MLTQYYHIVVNYLTGTFGANFIFLIILLSTAASVTYFIVIAYMITQMDKRYFIRQYISDVDSGEKNLLRSKLSGLSLLLINMVKIIVGLILLLCGLVMLVLPGQGLLTILIGLSLIPFPGKNKIEDTILARKSVRSSLNWIRTKANKEPFIFD